MIVHTPALSQVPGTCSHHRPQGGGCPTWRGADGGLSHVAGSGCRAVPRGGEQTAGCPTWRGADDGLSHVVGSGRQGLRRAPAVSVPLGWPPATWQTAHHPHTTWGLTSGANTHSTMQVGP